jgi:cell division protease FtsH
MIARQMLGRWGMSDTIGFVRVLPADGGNPFLTGAGETSEATQRLLDEEVHQLVDTAHREVTTVLSGHRDRLETLAQALLKAETLDELDAYAAAQMPPRAADPGTYVGRPIAADTSPPPSDPEPATDATGHRAPQG